MSNLGRIVLVLPRFPEPSETFIAAKFAGMLARGWDVHVACRVHVEEGWEHHTEVLDRRGMQRRVHVLPASRPRWRVPLEALGTFARSLLRAPRSSLRYLARHVGYEGLSGLRHAYDELDIAALEPALIHFEFGALAPARMCLPRALGCRSVVSFRGYDICYSHLAESGFYDPVWAQADRIHVLGEDLWQRALERGCPANMPRTMISPAIDAERFTPAPSRPRGTTFRIVSVGRLHWKKGHEWGLLTMARLVARGFRVRWTIVGDGPARPGLAFTVQDLGLQDHVTLRGVLTPSEVREVLADSDVFFHPAVSEGFCNAVLEAQAMGLPVVASDAEGLRENLAHGETGFVVPKRDPRALAEAIARLIEEPELLESMRREGPLRVREHFSWASHLDRWEALYVELLAGESVGS